MAIAELPFYTTGGTLPTDASSYVERQADWALPVLTIRQVAPILIWVTAKATAVCRR
jgi:hypothetical protein